MTTLLNCITTEITYDNLYHSIIQHFRNTLNDDNFPTTLKEFDLLVAKKIIYLHEDLDINLTSKKINISRNIVAKFLWDLKGGYKQIKGTWNNIIDSKINALNNSKNMPLEVILFKDMNEDIFLKLKNDSPLDVKFNKNGFINESSLILNYEELESNSDFEVMSSEYEYLLYSAFFASEVAIDIGNSSYGTSMGLGNPSRDQKYLQDTFGVSFANYDYYSANSSESPIIGIKMIRPSDERINELTLMLNNLKKDF